VVVRRRAFHTTAGTIGRVATTSARTLKLLSILGTGVTLTAEQLADRLGVSTRTVRRDIDTLRALGYGIEPVHGTGGGYRLRRGVRLPPVVFDEEQAVAAAVALQTVPSILSGIRESAMRALTTLRQVMSDHLRVESDAFTVTSARNYWEFPAPPIDSDVVRAIGAAIRQRHALRLAYTGEEVPVELRVEPHDLVVWAARWYLVAFDVGAQRWRAMRVDRITPEPPTYASFTRRQVPQDDPVTFVMTTHDRGDRVADWRCTGTAVMALPASVVARFAPGGSTVEHVSDDTCRLTLGAWSWVGLAGLLLTFDADLSEVRPAELRQALATIRRRIGRIGRVGQTAGPPVT
jgi:predicted DNA-binding transcriptional regulator YafY